jgi:hypothetical protein
MTSSTPKPSIHQLTHAEVQTLARGGTVSIPAGSLIAIPSPNHPSALDADSSTPKPRAGEHTETDEVNEQCAAIGGETIGNLRNNFAVMRQHARNLEAERDSLAAQNRELHEALETIAHDAESLCDPSHIVRQARALLTKHGR